MKVLADCFHKCLERSQNSPEFHCSANFTQKIRPLKLYILKQYQKKRLFDGFPVSKANMFKDVMNQKWKFQRDEREGSQTKLYIIKQYQRKRLFDGFPVSKAKMFKGHYEAKIKISREIGERGV